MGRAGQERHGVEAGSGIPGGFLQHAEVAKEEEVTISV